MSSSSQRIIIPPEAHYGPSTDPGHRCDRCAFYYGVPVVMGGCRRWVALVGGGDTCDSFKHREA